MTYYDDRLVTHKKVAVGDASSISDGDAPTVGFIVGCAGGGVPLLTGWTARTSGFR